ncbi:MAG: flagellin [Anaerobiospirillum succiniciproducens]|uniref:flagellin N-terminal helical domain-containing protein n=1 Tax=Anaerobiospirillum succiniciproducens TaxID=13335 RepID=UPI002A753274|nr:flagellin [Anaerobiospirillum succiniciproducens]MDY2798755.1 flagellin [Anaerobiospirillum succiniciproducens]
MAVFVNTNYSALQGQRYLGNVQNQLTTTYQRLSSGMRINSAKDDAAGLQIADRLTSQINGLNQGNRNASDGIALAQTMEAGMDEISGMLQKMRTLTVQASNGTNTQSDRDALAKEMSSLATEVNRIAMKTTFAGKTILNGKSKDTSSLFGQDNTNGSDKGAAGSDGTMTLQVGSNKGDTISFNATSVMFSKLNAPGDAIMKEGDGIFQTNKDTGVVVVKLSKADFSTPGNANYIGNVIDMFDKMLATVDGQRADLGAIQNRLESSIRNQSNVAANEADARSRIRDADFAEESANLSQQSIIQQAAASMLMQANTRPQLGLSLLG